VTTAKRGTRNAQHGTPGDPLRARAGVSGVQLAQVLELVADSDIDELDITTEGTRISIRRRPTADARATSSASDGALPAADSPSLAITSPLVGIFRPSVASGEAVQPGQSIGAIEALGMPTTVDAPQSGTVEDLLVPDGSPVEYGQPLLILRRAAHEP
jgi:acetyl-CoA carboxylase biotin carboxyl carrier protein